MPRINAEKRASILRDYIAGKLTIVASYLSQAWRHRRSTAHHRKGGRRVAVLASHDDACEVR